MKKIALGLVAAATIFMAVPAMAQVGFYAGPGGVDVQVGGIHRDDTLLAHGRRLGLVHADLKQPAPKRRPALEPADSVEHRDPGLLHNILSFRRTSEHAVSDAE